MGNSLGNYVEGFERIRELIASVRLATREEYTENINNGSHPGGIYNTDSPTDHITVLT